MNCFIFIYFSLLFVAYSQQLPDTDIHIYLLQTKKNKWKKIKSHYSDRYENQVYFIDNKNYVFVKQEGKFTEVYISKTYRNKERILVRDTVNLFSPLPLNKNEIQCIIQDRFGRQFVKRYKIAKSSRTFDGCIIPHTEMAGYHAIIHSDTLAFYHVGTKQHSLRIIFPDGRSDTVGSHPLISFYSPAFHSLIWAEKNDSITDFFEYSLPLKKNSFLFRERGISFFVVDGCRQIIYCRGDELIFRRPNGEMVKKIRIPSGIDSRMVRRIYLSPNGRYVAFVLEKPKS